MKYILYSPPHNFVRPAFKQNGETIPEEIFPIEARTLYRHRLFPDRRYRSSFPCSDPYLTLVVCTSLKRAKEEQASLFDYCGETFEIREFENRILGNKVK